MASLSLLLVFFCVFNFIFFFSTGEMSHHDILEATSRGVSCILCEHSNTERGFLKVFKEILEKKLCSNVRISISQKDKDPIDIV